MEKRIAGAEPLKVLYLEDSPQDAEITRGLLTDAGYDLCMDCTARESEFVSRLRSRTYDVILADFKLPGFDAVAALRWCIDLCPAVPFICVSGSIGEETAVGLLKLGAVDYILKDGLIRLPAAIKRALDEAKEKEARRRAEKALRDSEVRYRRLFETAKDGILILDAETGFIVDVNPYLIGILGYTREQFLGKRIWELGFFKDIVSNRDNFLELQQKEYVRYEDLPLETADGRTLEVEFVSNVYSVRNTKVIQCNIRNITERKLAERTHRLAEEALSESELALRTLVNANPEAVFLIDTAGVVLIANETFARRSGKIPDQLVGARIYDFLPPGVAEAKKKRVDEALRTGEPLRFEDVNAGMYIDNYIYPIKNAQGKVTRLAVLGVDVTGHKQTEERLKEQAALLDIASDAILVEDIEGGILYWNKSAESIYGWRAFEVRGKNANDILSAEAYASEPGEAQKSVLERGEWKGDLHQRTKHGKDLIVEGHWTLVRDEGGNPKGILSVNSDVTVQRSIQAQLMRSQRLESLGTIAGGIAHDLNNVLTPILMGAESLQVQYVDEVSRNIIDIITRSAERGAGIVRQVLSFARGIEGDRKEVQLTHILREIERIILETFPKSIELRCETPKGLWPVSGDATQLHQVLMNLCVNARDAMPNGGRLTLHAENIRLDETFARMNIEAKPIRYVMLKVEDIGSGMPPDVLEKIFDPFFTTKAPGKGTGLGLATTLSIVKSHGGFINVYSEVNKGSSFKVYVPAVEQGAPVSAEELEEIPMGEGELILVVDDEAAVRDITRRILESYGYRVVMAGDGTEALALYVQNKGEIRAMITDMMMPYMDGTSTIRAIRKIDPGARIIATSGLMTNEYAKEAAGLGVQAFLTKPYTAKTFMKTLRDVLSSTP